MGRNGWIAIVVVIAAAGGFWTGWTARGHRAARDLDDVTLTHEVERMSFSANGLMVMQNERCDRLENLLWFGLTSGLKAAEEAAARGARLPVDPPTPNLINGLERAEVTAETRARTDLADRLVALRSRITHGS